MKRAAPIATAMILALTATPLFAAPIVYPAKGQSAAQQQADQGECQTWAVENTGIDPAAVADQSAQQQQQMAAQAATPAPAPERSRGGALRGAAAGAVIGEIADDDAGKGAAYGAAAGAVAQRRRNVKAEQSATQQQAAQQQQMAQQQQQAAQQQQAQLDTFYRAYGACMEGRGYTVN